MQNAIGFLLGYRSCPMLDLSHDSSPEIELRKSLQSIWKHHGDIQHLRKSVLISEFSAAVRVLLRVLHPFFMSWACHKIRKPQSHHFPINILQV